MDSAGQIHKFLLMCLRDLTKSGEDIEPVISEN